MAIPARESNPTLKMRAKRVLYAGRAPQTIRSVWPAGHDRYTICSAQPQLIALTINIIH